MDKVPEITMWQIDHADVYQGTREQLIGADIARADQFPSPGKAAISYSRGQVVRRNFRKDETYLRLEKAPHGRWRAFVGVPRDVAAERVRVRMEKYHADDASTRSAASETSRFEAAKSARATLAAMPNSEDAYRRSLVNLLRHWGLLSLTTLASCPNHGYDLDEATLATILAAFDGVVERIMQAEVRFDAEKHMSITSALHAKIASAEPVVSGMVAQLTRPNPSILAGEMA